MVAPPAMPRGSLRGCNAMSSFCRIDALIRQLLQWRDRSITVAVTRDLLKFG
ncbi:hypothetical protein XHC_0894 [Xanthomonas hortorum pv. carotae str. M081]|nr:hypothetical protein XHC_0894 [Xanthomonas hortorum pv. carotae str. M081]